ncbi:HAD-IIB family hydrolase [Haloferula sargassicola]|uniref:Mannosylfructose-phosphate phosphatase n=1 Tax=Haloferula sargassicola TaxID=490096 RepID=A0ABP9UNY3_9BACT
MENQKPVRLLCSDIDGTLLGVPEATRRLRAAWEALPPDRPILVFSTGRLLDDALKVAAEHGLPMPDYVIGGVGTMIFNAREQKRLDEFSTELDQGWERGTVDRVVRGFSGIDPQPDEQQHPWKSSWFWHGASPEQIAELEQALADAGVGAQVIYSSARDLDVLPLAANKGNALRWICGHLGLGTDEAVAAGDTGNDVRMLLEPGVRGIAVGNAEPELREAIRGSSVYAARGECAAGVLEGLIHFGVIREEIPATNS